MLSVPEPIRFNGQKCRSEILPDIINRICEDIDLDIIVFTEFVNNKYTRYVSKKIHEHGWIYRSGYTRGYSPLGDSVHIFSRYPILETKCKHVNFDCGSYDCFVNKGFVFVKILKNDQIVNLIGLHLQAGNTNIDTSIRKKQLISLNMFISNIKTNKEEPLIITGDFNIDLNTDRKTITDICKNLNIVDLTGKNQFTINPDNNTLVGNDDPDFYISEEYPYGCYDKYIKTSHCECCPRQLLDFSLYCEYNKSPIECDMFVKILNVENLEIQYNLTTVKQTNSISDHHPIITRFLYSSNEKKRNIKYNRDKTHTKSNSYLYIFLVFSTLFILILFRYDRKQLI